MLFAITQKQILWMKDKKTNNCLLVLENISRRIVHIL